jgi:4-diphosphocytidyl-2-C-methyl-D-erythritol kinase
MSHSGAYHLQVRTERAHAKINLVLRILAREASGYHGIETLFQRLALHDVVHVATSDAARSLHCHGVAMPAAGLGDVQQNLAWRAADAYTRAARWDTGWQIDIDKQIPVGGGLGGGSADAAAVLRALEAMSPTPLGEARLLEIAGTLGADVPFLLAGDALAWAWGRGDRLLALPALPRMAVTLVVFDQGVNTGAAYGAFSRWRDAQQQGVSARHYGPATFTSWREVAAVAANDFEVVVPSMHDGVAQLLPMVLQTAAALQREGHAAIGRMSGSGATCFVLHPDTTPVELVVPAGTRLVHTHTMD